MGQSRPAKRRRLTPPVDDNIQSETVHSSELFHKAADWDLEQDYEQRSRRKKVKEITKLPIKTREGQLQQVEVTAGLGVDADGYLSSSTNNKDNRLATPPPTDEAEPARTIPLDEQISAAKEEIARLDSLLKEDPEEHAGAFKKLGQIANNNSHPKLQQLVLLAQAAVYRDAIPGYRIRAYNDDDLGNKVSKDVRRTRQYEHSLITGYQIYVKTLTTLCRDRSNEKLNLRVTALNCISMLLLSVPHFNFRTELLNALGHEMSSKEHSNEFRKSVKTLEEFFQKDDDGAPSLEAVNVISRMIKAKDFDVQEEVLNTFFHLRLLTELSAKSSTTKTESLNDVSKLHGKKSKKDKWEHRSKKERKIARERKAVEKDMKEASAAVDYEAREKMQSETLKVVFIVYFRVLKAKIAHLTGAVLEGLARYAHLINQDFFGDILEALKDIINEAEGAEDDELDAEDVNLRNHTRERLLSTQTAFTLLSHQDTAKSASALHLDLSFFTSTTYRSLYHLTVDPDIELSPKSMRLPDPHSGVNNKKDNKINIVTPILLLIRTLTSILLTPSQPPTTQVIVTFYKRLLTMSLHLPEKSATALLSLMHKIADKHGRKLEPLWYSDERKGDGIFQGEAQTVEHTNIFATGTGVWENELLRYHYCPQVKEQSKEIDKVISSLAK